MKAIEIKDIVNGIITIILIALACGHYGKLRDFAISEARQAMKVGKLTPAFFPKNYDVMKDVKRY